MAVRLPGLLGPDLTEKARLSPSAASLTLKMHGPGEAQLTVPEDGPAVSVHDWISIYTQKGFAGVFRVTNVAQNYRKQIDLTLLHGIDILSDSVWQAQMDYDGSVSGFLSALLSQQTHLINGVKPWVLGTCEDTGTIKKSINYDRLSNLLESLEEEGGGYYFTYDQSTWPWTVSYVAKPDTVSSEFRLARNVRTASVTFNDADLCTRLILSVNTGEGDSAKVTIRTYDNQAAQAIWGVVIKTADIDTGDTPPGTHTAGSFSEADAWAQAFLAQRPEPSVQIQIEGEELGKITGDTWDEYSVAALCRASLPDYGRSFDERVVSVTYPELISQETRVTVSLANALPRFSENIASAQRAAASASRSARASARAVQKQEQEITHWSQRVEHVEDALDETGIETLYASGIDLDAEQGVTIYSLAEGLQSMYSAIKVNRDSISLESQRILMVASQAGTGAEMFDPTHSYQIGDRVGYNGKMYEFTAAHSGTEENPLPWDPTHVQEVASLQDQIADNAGDIYDITQSAIMQNASSITGVVGKFEIDSQGNLVVKDGGAFKLKKNNVEYGLYSEDNLTAGLVVGLINNQQTGEGVTVARITADKIILDGTATATTLDARLANVDDLFTTQGYSQTIYTGTIYTNNVHITSTNAETGVTSSKNFSPKSVYIGNTLQEMEFLGNDAHHVSLSIPNAVTGFGTAGTDPTTGEVTIPFYTYDNPSTNWNSGNKINFNIADTVFYQNHVGIASVTPAGWTNDGEGGGYYNLVTASANDGSDDDASVSLPTISLSAALGTAASGSVQAYGPAVDGTAYPVSTALTLYLQPVGDMIYLTNSNSTPTAGSSGNIVAQLQHQGSQTTVNVDKSAWTSGGITFSTNPASGTGAAVSLAFVIPANTSSGSAQISVVDSASPGSSSQPLSTGLSKTLTLTCDDNYATLKDGGTTVARVPNNKSVGSGYDAGWGAAYGKVSLPNSTNLSTAYITIGTPPSTVDGNADQTNYYLDVQNYYAYIRYGGGSSSDPIVARTSHSVYTAGQQSVAPTSASISSSTLNSSTGKREATLTVYYKGPDTAEDSEPLSGVDVTSIYNAGKADGSTKSTYPVTFTVTFDDGHTGTVTADCKDIWNQGAADAPAVTTMYAYQSQGSFVNVRNRATSESSAVVGAITTNTPVTYIRTSSGGGYTYVYISYSNNGGTPGYYWINSNFLRSTNGWNSQYNYLGWYGSSGGGDEPGPDDSIEAVTITGLVHQAQYYNGRFPITIAPLYPNSSGGYPTSFNSNVSANFANFGTSADGTASMSDYFSIVYATGSYYATNNTQSDMGPSDTECQHKMTVRVDLKNGTSYTRLITFKSKYR